jgi:hypothetical protein
MALYLNQNINDQGFPSKEKRNCGSKASLLFPTDRSNIAAGFPKVNIGSREIPLFVTEAAPEIWKVLSAVWPLAESRQTKNSTANFCVIQTGLIDEDSKLDNCMGIEL